MPQCQPISAGQYVFAIVLFHAKISRGLRPARG